MKDFIDRANAQGFIHESKEEVQTKEKVYNLLKNTPIYPDEILNNLTLFLNPKSLGRILFFDRMYQLITEIPGVVMEMGVQWGGGTALFNTLRGIYEPYNVRRKIISFDTFEGFPSVDSKDGNAPLIGVGNLSLPEDYTSYLSEILENIERNQPISHIKKYELVKGDACKTVPEYLEKNPETMIALAYFDFDIYEPTKKVLKCIKPRLFKGSVIGFDELNDPSCPGETLAVMETLGLNNLKLKKVPWYTKACYCVVE